MKKTLNAMFVAMLALPMLQKAVKFLPEPVLVGVETRGAKTPLSAGNWFSGKFAADFEARLGVKIGFRGYFVKLSNQIDYSLFGKIRGRRGTQIVVGRDNWLYEQAYIDYFIKNPALPGGDLKRYAGRIRQLQDALQKRGVVFLLVISPSKVEIYPEYLPAPLREQCAGRRHRTIRQELLTRLDEAGVRYVDAHALFKDLKRGSDVLFAPQGTHWNYYGSLLAVRRAVQCINASGLLSVPVPEVKSVRYLPALGSDNDLELLMNLLWFDKTRSPPIPYPEVMVEAVPPAERPDFLVVGDSFSFTVVDSIRYARLSRNVDLLYYNKRLYSYPPEEFTDYAADHPGAEVGPLAELPPEERDRLAGAEVVILEINEILLNKGGWGFIEEAVARLR